MSQLLQTSLDPDPLRELLLREVTEPAVIDDLARRTLAGKFRVTAGELRRRLDSRSLELVSTPSRPFRWTAARARRAVGRAALARLRRHANLTIVSSVRDQLDELAVAAAAGYARPGSLARWIAHQPPPVVATTEADAQSWVIETLETFEPTHVTWTVSEADAFYDVAAARTTLRGQRDVVVTTSHGRTLVRLRRGAPGPHAGTGLRCDLAVDALVDVEGRAADLAIGIWPDAGIALGVEGTLDNVRQGVKALWRLSSLRQDAPSRAA